MVAAGDGGVDRGLAELGLDVARLRLGEALADVVAQLVERVEARLGGELVVEAGQLLGLDLLDRDRELGLLAREVLGAVVLGELDLDRALVAGGRALELLLEAGDEPARAELDHLVAALAAAERLAAERAEEVHDHEVAGGGGALDGLELGHAVAQLLDLLLDRLVGDLGIAAADLEPLVLAELGLRADADLDREAQRLALARELAEIEVGLADRDDLGGVDGGRVPAGDRLADRLVEHGLAPDALDDHGRRDLALAEAGDAQVAAERLRGLGDALLDLGGGHLGLDADARLGQLGDGGGDGDGHQRRLTIPWHSMRTRFAGWLVCGPLGHLAAGVADWAVLVVRWQLAERQARRREIRLR